VFPGLQFDPPSLFGRPVYIAELPAPAASAKSLVFGDMKRAYGIRRVNGVTFQRQEKAPAGVPIRERRYAAGRIRIDGVEYRTGREAKPPGWWELRIQQLEQGRTEPLEQG